MKNTLAMAEGLAAAGHSVRVLAPGFSAAPPFVVSRARLRVLRSGPAWSPLAARKLLYYARLVAESAAGADACILPYSLRCIQPGCPLSCTGVAAASSTS